MLNRQRSGGMSEKPMPTSSLSDDTRLSDHRRKSLINGEILLFCNPTLRTENQYVKIHDYYNTFLKNDVSLAKIDQIIIKLQVAKNDLLVRDNILVYDIKFIDYVTHPNSFLEIRFSPSNKETRAFTPNEYKRTVGLQPYHQINGFDGTVYMLDSILVNFSIAVINDVAEVYNDSFDHVIDGIKDV